MIRSVDRYYVNILILLTMQLVKTELGSMRSCLGDVLHRIFFSVRNQFNIQSSSLKKSKERLFYQQEVQFRYFPAENLNLIFIDLLCLYKIKKNDILLILVCLLFCQLIDNLKNINSYKRKKCMIQVQGSFYAKYI